MLILIGVFLNSTETGSPVRHAPSCLQQSDRGHAHGQEAAGNLLQSGFLWPGKIMIEI